MTKRELTDRQYLQLFKINENKYLIGIYQDGITIHKQQIRALNIFHALYNTKLKAIKDPGYTIGIIGGGVAGITFATAALEAGYNVTLFEKKSIYLHMQFGCDIRKIHPNLYEWPDRRYSNPYAELPVLDWKHDSASNVVKQILRGWETTKKKIRSKGPTGAYNLIEILSCDIKSIEQNVVKNKTRFQIKYETPDGWAVSGCDLLIFATGYGVERGVEEAADTPSYWRNDYYAQIELHAATKTYIVSGVGDGGLIDLFRLKIFDFSYEQLLDIIENNREYPDLLRELTRIKKEVLSDEKAPVNTFFRKFSDLNQSYYKYIFETIASKGLFLDNEIWLNDLSMDFEQTLDHKKISFLHAFLIFIFIRFGKRINLSYHGGLLVFEKGKGYLLNGKPVPENSFIIIRHGTNRDGSIPSFYFSGSNDASLKVIKERQEKYYNHGVVVRRWSNADLIAIFNPALNKRYEYLNAATSVVCTSYVSGLSNLIKNYYTEKANFRVALYRQIYVRGEYFFQQVTSYFGSEKPDGNNSIGQVFTIDRGNVGQSFTTGRPTLILQKEEQHFDALIRAMGLSKDLDRIKADKSFFTLPILAPVKGSRIAAANLVLSVESQDLAFFETKPGKDNIISLIIASTLGFVETISHHIKFNELKMADLDFEPLVVNNKLPPYFHGNPCFEDPCKAYTGLEPDKSKLKLGNFYSFSII